MQLESLPLRFTIMPAATGMANIAG